MHHPRFQLLVQPHLHRSDALFLDKSHHTTSPLGFVSDAAPFRLAAASPRACCVTEMVVVIDGSQDASGWSHVVASGEPLVPGSEILDT
jgi:hypothetical protein